METSNSLKTPLQKEVTEKSTLLTKIEKKNRNSDNSEKINVSQLMTEKNEEIETSN